MTRATIDFGIDLGTTNSSIAVLTNGRPLVIRSNDQQEITPSAVMVDKKGVVSIGKQAYDTAYIRPGSVAREFKRDMGTDTTVSLSGRVMTPEDLSAEILKGLRADAQARLGEDVTASVVTVPAMFTLAACDATVRAARQAGITQSPLLQEPIAAGLAYGIQEEAAEGYWLVYDLGGGTFDASLMTIRQGRLQVVDHGGDEFLGGKNFDDALIDYVVDRLRQEYQIEGTVRGQDPKHQLLYAKLKAGCEQAKIYLSRLERTTVDVLGTNDDANRAIDTDIEITRSVYESLVEPFVARTIRIVSDLIVRNGLRAEAIERLILVGGPTLTPYVRARLQAETNIKLETRVDPMTVVAQGAAIYAGSVFREAARAVPSGPADGIQIALTYPPVSEEPEALIGGRVQSDIAGTTVQVERQDGGWASGRIPVNDKTFVISVSLQVRAQNRFRLRLFDSAGTQMKVRPDEFEITHGLVADQPPLSRSLGVAVEKDDANPRTEFLLRRGSRLPASQLRTLRTTRPVVPGQPAGINIHVVEGESDRADRNDHVGMIRLDGTKIRRPLPVGSEIRVKFSMDTSRTLSVTAFVPLLDDNFPVTIDEKNRQVPDVAVLENQVKVEEERVASLGEVGTVGEAPGLLGEVNQQLEVARTGDKGAAMQAQRRLRELQALLDGATDAAGLQLLEAEWQEALPKSREIVGEFGDAGDRQRLALLEREWEEARLARNQVQMRQRVEQVRSLFFGVLTAQPAWWIGFYQDLVERQSDMTDPNTARVLIQQGRKALDRQDFDALRETCTRLWDLLPSTGRAGMSRGLPDVYVRV